MSTGGEHFWDRTVAVWHLVFAAGLGLAMVSTVTDDAMVRGDKVALLAALGALGAWYAATGAVAMHRCAPRLGHLYLIGLVPLFGLLLMLESDLGFLLFIVVPQVYFFVESMLWASLWVVGLYGMFGVLVVHDAPAELDRPGTLIQLGVSAAFSVVMGLWISGIVRQSQQRAGLIAELERTRAELATERHQAGIAAERARLAGEIHDTLAQGFTSILMLSQAADAALARGPGGGTGGVDVAVARRQLDLVERTARENLAEARALVAALAPADLDGATLPEALRRLAERVTRDTGTQVKVVVTGSPAGTCADSDVVLLRAAQEALSNVRRHAAARSVCIRLAYGTGGRGGTGDADGTVLTVTDDGRGFSPAEAHGFGLRAMRSRVVASGGTLDLRSRPAAGTTLQVMLP